MKPLEPELQFFGQNHLKWREIYLGKFVLVKGWNLIGAFETAEEAISNGARLFGTDSFLVRRVDAEEEQIYIPALALGL